MKTPPQPDTRSPMKPPRSEARQIGKLQYRTLVPLGPARPPRTPGARPADSGGHMPS